MSLRSDPNANPTKPDPVTRNQPEAKEINTEERSGTENMPGNYSLSSEDSTSSGGFGAAPEKLWSSTAQTGTDMPLKTEKNPANNDTGLIDQSTSGIDLEDKVQDAIQGKDSKLTKDLREDNWGIEKGAEKDF